MLVRDTRTRLADPITPADHLLGRIYQHFAGLYAAGQPSALPPAELLHEYETACADRATFHATVEIAAHLAYQANPPTAPTPTTHTDPDVWVIAAFAGLALILSTGRHWLAAGVAFCTWCILYFLSARVWRIPPTTKARALRVVLVLAASLMLLILLMVIQWLI